MKIPLSQPDLGGNEIKYAKEALDSGWISSLGVFVERAEAAWASFCDVPYCAVVNNGTSALHLALMALDLRPGDEVLVPAMTFVSPAAVVKRMGAIPVFVDVEPISWCIDPKKAEALITNKTKGIIAVDVLGHPADFKSLRKIADRHGLFLVEDAAEAHGSRLEGKRVGGLADISTFSFFANKTIGCGEGGAITTHNTDLYKKCVLLKNHGMDKAKPYWHDFVGDNFRMTNPTAAILLGQIERAEQLMSKRKAVANRYRLAFDGKKGIKIRPHADWAEVVPWIESFQVTEESGLTREQVVSFLREKGIDARSIWFPLVSLPPYQEDYLKRGVETPIANKLMMETFWLPTSTVMTEEDVGFVIESMNQILSR